jgi:hypothetical protein
MIGASVWVRTLSWTFPGAMLNLASLGLMTKAYTNANITVNQNEHLTKLCTFAQLRIM